MNASKVSNFILSVEYTVMVHDVLRDAMIISLMDTFTSLFAGFTIFSVLGYLKYITQAKNFDDIVSGGTTLVFVSYPTAIAAFEHVPQVSKTTPIALCCKYWIML